MIYNPKKIIGRICRKYGGSTYENIRKKFLDLIKECKDYIGSIFILFNRNAPFSQDKDLDHKLYHDNPESIIKPGVILMLDGAIYHGGLTDRLRGILTAYRECRKRRLNFYIYWDTPFKLTDYLIPTDFDWRIDQSEISRSRLNSKAVVIDDMSDTTSLLRLKAALINPPAQLHLYTNADSAKGEYSELYPRLFKPSDRLREEVEKHKQQLGKHYWAFNTRFLTSLGDFTDWHENVLEEAEQLQLMEKVRDEFLRMAKEIPAESRIHFSSDSKKFLQFIRNADPRIYIVEGDIKNIDLNRGNNEDAWLKTFIDQQLIMGADTVVRLQTDRMYPTGFSRFAAEVGQATFIDHKF